MAANTSPTCVLWHVYAARPYTIKRFTLKNWGISREYEIEVVIREFDTCFKPTHRVCLDVEGHYFHGFVSGVEQIQSEHHSELKLQIKSPLAFLLDCFHTRIYSELSIGELLQRLLEEAGLLNSDFKLALHQATASVWFYQDNERTIDFLRNILHAHGIVYRYQQTQTDCICVFSDHLYELMPNEALDMAICRPSGLQNEKVSHISSKTNKLCTQGYVKHFYRPYASRWQNETFLSCHADAIGKKTHISSPKDALSKVTQRINDENAHQILLNTWELNFQPGQEVCFKTMMTDRPGYRVCAIDLDGAFEQPEDLKAFVKADVNAGFKLRVRASLSDAFCGFSNEGGGLGSVQRFQRAQIEHTESLYPELSNNGRYHLRLLSDEREGEASPLKVSRTAKASLRLRNALYSSGNHYGMSYPFRKECTVVVGFENGIGQVPLILGSLPNQTYASVVNSKNPGDNVIRSFSDNYLSMSVLNEVKTCILATARQQNFLKLVQQKDSSFQLATLKGCLEVEALKQIAFTAKQEGHLHAKGSFQARISENFRSRSHGEHLRLSTDESMTLSHRDTAVFKATEQAWCAKNIMNFQIKQALCLSARKNLTLQNKTHQQVWSAKQGKIILKSFKTLKIRCAGSVIHFEPDTITIRSDCMLQLNAAAISGMQV